MSNNISYLCEESFIDRFENSDRIVNGKIKLNKIPVCNDVKSSDNDVKRCPKGIKGAKYNNIQNKVTIEDYYCDYNEYRKNLDKKDALYMGCPENYSIYDITEKYDEKGDSIGYSNTCINDFKLDKNNYKNKKCNENQFITQAFEENGVLNFSCSDEKQKPNVKECNKGISNIYFTTKNNQSKLLNYDCDGEISILYEAAQRSACDDKKYMNNVNVVYNPDNKMMTDILPGCSEPSGEIINIIPQIIKVYNDNISIIIVISIIGFVIASCLIGYIIYTRKNKKK